MKQAAGERVGMEAVTSPNEPNGARRVDRPLSSTEVPESEAMRFLLAASGEATQPLELRRWIDLAEAWYITRTLRAVRGNRSKAARVLGIGRRTLYAKMQKLGIEASWRSAPPS